MVSTAVRTRAMRRCIGISYRERKTSSCHASAAQKVFELRQCPLSQQFDGPHLRIGSPYRATGASPTASTSTGSPTWTWTSTTTPSAASYSYHTLYCCINCDHKLYLKLTDMQQVYFGISHSVLGQPLCLTRLQTALRSEKSNAIVIRSRGWEEHTPPWHTGIS